MSSFVLISSLLLLLTLTVSLAAGPSKRRLLELGLLLVLSLPLGSWLWQATALPQITLPSIPQGSAWHAGLFLQIPCFIWGIGTILGLIQFFTRLYGVKQWLRESHSLPEELAEETACVLNLNPATVARRFRQARSDCGPAMLPSIPGRILLPAAWQAWSPSQRKAALRHEWHHAQHHDAHWSALMDFMLTILWFHPLAWILRSQWHDEIEHQADRAALGQIAATDYASELLRLIEAGQGAAHPVGVGFAHSSSLIRFRRRLSRLFEPQDETNHSKAIACMGAILLLSATLIALACSSRTSNPVMTQETHLRLNATPFPADP